MKTEKIVKELIRRGLEFRGELTKEQALQLPGFHKTNIEYAYSGECERMMYFAKRTAPENGKIGDAGTDCKDILIFVDNTNDDTNCHYVLEHIWHIPEMYSKENPDGVDRLELDEDCHITYCSHICGCCSETGWHFDETWHPAYSEDFINAFDCIADNKNKMGFLPETCKPLVVSRPGYRN